MNMAVIKEKELRGSARTKDVIGAALCIHIDFNKLS